MERLILFFLTLVLFNSCRALIEPTKVIDNIEEKLEVKKSYVTGKIINKEQKPITAAAIKLVINNKSCLSTYSNFDGDFSFLLDISKINEDSYFEIVYKEYSKKIILYNQFINKVIKIEKGNTIISETEYQYFYEKIRKCNR